MGPNHANRGGTVGTGVTAVNTSIWQIDLVTDHVQALGHAMLKWLVSVCVRCSFRLDFVSYLNEILKERAPPLLCLQEQAELCAVAFPLRDPKRRRTPELLVRSDLQVGAAVHESSCRECMALEGSVVQRCESTVSGAAEDLRVDIERCAAEQILHDGQHVTRGGGVQSVEARLLVPRCSEEAFHV